jgi:hypothetical protein
MSREFSKDALIARRAALAAASAFIDNLPRTAPGRESAKSAIIASGKFLGQGHVRQAESALRELADVLRLNNAPAALAASIAKARVIS